MSDTAPPEGGAPSAQSAGGPAGPDAPSNPPQEDPQQGDPPLEAAPPDAAPAGVEAPDAARMNGDEPTRTESEGSEGVKADGVGVSSAKPQAAGAAEGGGADSSGEGGAAPDATADATKNEGGGEPAPQGAAGGPPEKASGGTAERPSGDRPPPRRDRGDDRRQGGPQGGDGQARPPRPTVVVRYGVMGNIGECRHNLDPPPARGSKVVVRTERGVELGEVVVAVRPDGGCGCLTRERLREFAKTNGPDYPMRRDGRVLRVANPQDVIDYRHLQQSAREAGAFCRQEIEKTKLEMRLVTVEHLLGGERIVFFFSAEHRVDFRELVRRLAGQYRTRIEMRQVGARDEARLVGDYERCGQQCCCQRFLKYLKPVSMRMAKTQKATLDPSKISGRCGRLMCCLRYEDSTYEQLRKKLPRRNTWVRTKDLVGRVVDTQILTQLVRVQLTDATHQAVAVEDIIERDVAPPKPPPPVAERSRRGRPEPGKPPARPAGRD